MGSNQGHKKYYRGTRTKRHGNTNKQNTNIGKFIGKVICMIQLMLTLGFSFLLWHSGLLPIKYLVIVIIALLVLFGVTFAVQFPKGNVFITGIVISLIISILLGFGIYYLTSANHLLKNITGAKYKTDNMVAVVLNEDPAQTLEDARDYTFGINTAMDLENTKKMIQNMEEEIGTPIKVKEYGSIQELGSAILSQEVGAGIYNESMSGILQETVEGYDGATRVLYQYGIHTEIEEEDSRDVTKPFSIFISGIDVNGPISTNSRSDVNIIMTVNPMTKKIVLTTTPRDFYVTIPGVSGEARDKLTHAGIYGVDASINTLENLYGIDIQYYARVNFDSVVQIVDAVGGVDVESEEAFITTVGGYSIGQGNNHLDGKQALAFVRERYNVAGGDNQRGKNQQKVITAILKKVMSPSLLMNFNSLVASVEGSVQTNMSHEEMQELVSSQLASGVDFQIESLAASGTGGSDICFSTGAQSLYVMYPDEGVVNDIRSHLQGVINGE